MFWIPNIGRQKADCLFSMFCSFKLFYVWKKWFGFRCARNWKRDFEKSLIRHQRMWCRMEEPVLWQNTLLYPFVWISPFLCILWTMKQWLTVSPNSTHKWKSYIAPYTWHMIEKKCSGARKKKEKQKLKAFHRIRIVNICNTYDDMIRCLSLMAGYTISLITSILYIKHICNYKVSFVWWLHDKGIFCAHITLTNPSIK